MYVNAESSVDHVPAHTETEAMPPTIGMLLCGHAHVYFIIKIACTHTKKEKSNEATDEEKISEKAHAGMRN